MEKFIIIVEVDEKTLMKEYISTEEEKLKGAVDFTIEEAIREEMGWVASTGISVVDVKKEGIKY